MAVYWVTEALPLPITGLLPIVLFPVFGIIPAKDIATKYISDASIVFMGGMILALAIEKSQLHRRLALRMLMLVGSKPESIAIGFMLPTWFLSMWISNTATTAMMITVVPSVIDRLKERVMKRKKEREETAASNLSFVPDTAEDATYFGIEPSQNDEKDIPILRCLGGENEKQEQKQKQGQEQGETTTKYSKFFPTEINEISEGTSAKLCHKDIEIIPDDTIKRQTGGNLKDSREYDSAVDMDADVDQIPNNVTVSVDVSCESADVDANGGAVDDEEGELKELKTFSKMLCLAIAYSSNIGGLATLTGTTTNILVAQIGNKIYVDHDLAPPITYTSWLLYGLPHSIICLVIMWAWLQLLFIGWRSFCYCRTKDKQRDEKNIKEAVRNEYNKLGTITFYEVSTTVFLVVLVLLWFTRDPGFVSGYAAWFKTGYVSDAVPAIFVSVLLFIFPSERPSFICWRKQSDRAKTVPALLDWKTVSTKLPWGPLIILGGGLALADACEVSGLSQLIGEALEFLAPLANWLMITLIVTIVTFFTEVTSNGAVLSLVSPILIAMTHTLTYSDVPLESLRCLCKHHSPSFPTAILFVVMVIKAAQLGMNPLYLLLPAAVACTCAFMLPVATPPNAIVFSYGQLRVIDMIKAGLALNLLCIPIVSLGIQTWGVAIFNLNIIPWATANINNDTTVILLSTAITTSAVLNS